MPRALDKDPERYAAVKARVAEGLSIAEISRQTGVTWETIKKHFPSAGKAVSGSGGLTLDKLDPEKYRKLGEMVADGASLMEIKRTLGCDHRTVKRYFPHAGWARGGAGDALESREANRKINELTRTGKIQANRDAGFNRRKDVL